MSLIWLIVGLVIFLGAHSVRIFAEQWRAGQIARLGEQRWKGLYSLASLAGFALIVWGYGISREHPVVLWDPPSWTRQVAALLTIITFVLWAAAYVPGNRIKAMLGHPMILGVKVWAFAHLISNGRLADVVLFGAFLVWAVLDFRAARQRDRAAGTRYPSGATHRDLATVAIGLIAWWVFAQYLHGWLIGVRPFG
jgi:uncharacterized membrane protein